MTKAVILTFMLLTFLTSVAEACNYYASPLGGGNGLSPYTPFQIADFWPVAGPGKTLCLLDGVYADNRSNIQPPKGMSGMPSVPITVMALSDGDVRIDGQNARNPVLLSGNSYFTIQGINANNSAGSVIALASGSNYNTMHRIVAWDARDENYEIFGIHDSNHNLLEDVAGFGVARKIFSFSQNGNDNICRRCWGRWEGSTNVGPKDTFEVTYNNYRNIYENIIGTWDNGSMPKSHTLQNNGALWAGSYARTYTGDDTDQAYGIIAEGQPNWNAETKILGSIAYVRAADKFPAMAAYFIQSGQSGLEFTNNVAYFDPSSHTSKPTFLLPSDRTEAGLIARNLTGIGGAGNKISGKWEQSKIEYGKTIDRISSIYTGANGAQICYQYHNGQLTKEPLWPWPMNRRILDATTFASILSHRHYIYQGSPPVLTLVNDPHTAVDVTSTIETLFGSIPAACKLGGNASRH